MVASAAVTLKEVSRFRIKLEVLATPVLIAPEASINRIRDYKVVKKEKVVLPNEIVGIINCPNPKCISNKEREPVKSVFVVMQRKPLILSCKYCEREVKGLFG